MDERAEGTSSGGGHGAVTARSAAAELLGRILDEGAYSNVVIRTGTVELSERDQRFVQRLVYETIRHLLEIDAILSAASTRPIDTVDPPVLHSLRIAVAELMHFETPPYAAIDGAVESVRRRSGERATAFANGVLRTIARTDQAATPGGTTGGALRLGVPEWMLERLEQTLGREGAVAFLEASNNEPQTGLRARLDRAVPGRPVPGIRGAFISDDPAAVSIAVSQGSVAIADPASVAVVLAVDAKPGDAVVDLAAAPGGKTLHLWDEMGGRGTLIAADLHSRRLRTTARRLPDGVHTIVADARRPPFRDECFDRVLLDAPCTGLGTLRRRPEIRHRLAPGTPAAFGSVQRSMLSAALGLLRPGGRLVYSVCTVFAEETIDVVAGLGGHVPPGVPGDAYGDGVLLAPHTTGTDGMFICVFDR